jgi:hypothetical protein
MGKDEAIPIIQLIGQMFIEGKYLIRRKWQPVISKQFQLIIQAMLEMIFPGWFQQIDHAVLVFVAQKVGTQYLLLHGFVEPRSSGPEIGIA